MSSVLAGEKGRCGAGEWGSLGKKTGDKKMSDFSSFHFHLARNKTNLEFLIVPTVVPDKYAAFPVAAKL